MPFQRLRRALLTAACASSFLLAACGGGNSVVSQFSPTRVVAFGDAFTDAGQNGAQYTTNPGTNWSQQLASRYGVALSATPGGTSYARGNARVNTHPDAAGNAATLTVTEQVDAFLGGQSPASGDLLIVSGGISDVIVEGRATILGNQAQAQASANLKQAAMDLAGQVIRLVNAGAQHVVVVGPYNLGRSPWAAATGQGTLLQTLVTDFNTQLKISLNGYGAKVLYVDAELYFNLATGNPAAYGFSDVTSVACTSVDGPNGIGTNGIGIVGAQVNANLCTPGTLNGGVSASTALFADPVYLTTAGNVNFGNYAYDRVHQRW